MKTLIWNGVKYECENVIWDDWQSDVYYEGSYTEGLYKSKNGAFFIVKGRYWSNGAEEEEYEKISKEGAIAFLQRIQAPEWAYKDAGIELKEE